MANFPKEVGAPVKLGALSVGDQFRLLPWFDMVFEVFDLDKSGKVYIRLAESRSFSHDILVSPVRREA
jgi:hypothetical protein